jgi:co-chaperonin GroES (HSP10)
MQTIIEKYQIPFKSPTGKSIEFPYKPLNGVVFVWPKPIQEKIGSIYLPEASRENFKSCRGVVLATSKGCVEKKTGVYRECELKVGDEILYDKNVPWNQMIEAADGKEYRVDIMSQFDINALVNDNEVIADEKSSVQESTEK